MKKCSSCKVAKPVTEFYRHAKSKDGLQTACAVCQRTRARQPHRARWKNAIARCYNPEHPQFKNYGARGIGVWGEWRKSYAAFAARVDAHLGPCPKGYSLDRINNDHGYVPFNLRWASAAEQNRNRRVSRIAHIAQRPAA